MNVKQKLKDEFESQMNLLNKMDVGTEQYKLTVDGVTKIADRIIEIEKNERDAELKEYQLGNETDSITAEIKNNRMRNVVEIAKCAVPVAAAFAMGIISMKWEKLDTITSSAGKSALRDILRFK